MLAKTQLEAGGEGRPASPWVGLLPAGLQLLITAPEKTIFHHQHRHYHHRSRHHH